MDGKQNRKTNETNNMTRKAFRQRQALLLAEQQRNQRIERVREIQAAYERSRPNAALATVGTFQYWNRIQGLVAPIQVELEPRNY
jgi:hypothetical protein